MNYEGLIIFFADNFNSVLKLLNSSMFRLTWFVKLPESTKKKNGGFFYVTASLCYG